MANILGFFKNYKEGGGVFWIEQDQPILQASRLFKNFKARLITISAFMAPDEEINLYYHFEVGNKLYTLKCKTKNKKIDSITSIFPSSDWIEKEIQESYGVEFIGHQNMTNLFLTSQTKTPLLKIEKRKVKGKAKG